MSFWNLSDGNQAAQTTTFELTKELEPIPAKTIAKAIVSEAKWASYMGDEYINLTWKVIDGPYKNRTIFQKVRVKDSDAKKADKAKSMLAAIATNAGGGLFAVQGEPNDSQLTQHLTMKPMSIHIMVWAINDEMTGETKKGNWISAVSDPRSADLAAASAPSAADGDDIPF